MYKVDLNADLGESFGSYTIGLDAEVTKYVTSANVACGFHAGDPLVLGDTLRLAKERGIAVGAHPGYPDLMGFGRRSMACSPDEVQAYVTYQLGAFAAFAKAHGLEIQHVKAHGAMYNTAGKDLSQALAICRAVRAFDPSIRLLALAGSRMVDAADELGLRCASEVFADRAYEEDGSLVARSKEGSMITDESVAISRVVRMVREGKVQAITGKDIPVRCDSVCVHGDNEHAVQFVKTIRERLTAEGIDVVPFGSFVSL